MHRGHPRRNGPRPQAVEAHAVPGRARARGQRRPVPPLPPRPFPRAPPGAAAGPRRTACRRRGCAGVDAGRGSARSAGAGTAGRGRARSAGAGQTERGGGTSRARGRAMIQPGRRGEPELTEPDLPRTAKVRPKALRTGWTTGTCASAAAKAATTALRDQAAQRTVEVALPSGRRVSFDVESCVQDATKATAVVVKDAGDDPDVTHGAHLTATVRWRTEPGIVLEGGEGVGIVTKPGLGIEVGEPAITATPDRKSTRLNSSHVEISYAVFCLKKKKKTDNRTYTTT